jgi:chemotaxis family two-component system response regulator Rcp1
MVLKDTCFYVPLSHYTIFRKTPIIKKPNILIVDDNPGDQRLIMESFKELGINCCYTLCSNGREGIDYLFRKEHGLFINIPNLIISDISMPLVNGFEVLDTIKSHPLFHTIPVVMFSSSDAQQDIAKAYHLGANSYVVKPDQFNDYKQAIHAMYNYWFKLNSLPQEIAVYK